jgi:hypothetical protein
VIIIVQLAGVNVILGPSMGIVHRDILNAWHITQSQVEIDLCSNRNGKPKAIRASQLDRTESAIKN